MDIGSRLRLIRLGVFCFPPSAFAEFIGITRQELQDIEAGSLHPSPNLLERISVITKTARGWYITGRTPATVNNWGYFELPFPEVDQLGEAKHQVIADIDHTWRTHGRDAIEDLAIKRYFVAELKGSESRYVVIPFRPDGACIFKVGDVLQDAIRAALEGGGAKLANSISITRDFAQKIGSPRQSHTDPKAVVELFDRLGLGKIPQSWNVDFDQIKFSIWRKESPKYKEKLRYLIDLLTTEELQDELISPTSAQLEFNYTRDELERLRPLAWKRELGLD